MYKSVKSARGTLPNQFLDHDLLSGDDGPVLTRASEWPRGWLREKESHVIPQSLTGILFTSLSTGIISH